MIHLLFMLHYSVQIRWLWRGCYFLENWSAVWYWQHISVSNSNGKTSSFFLTHCWTYLLINWKLTNSPWHCWPSFPELSSLFFHLSSYSFSNALAFTLNMLIYLLWTYWTLFHEAFASVHWMHGASIFIVLTSHTHWRHILPSASQMLLICLHKAYAPDCRESVCHSLESIGSFTKDIDNIPWMYDQYLLNILSTLPCCYWRWFLRDSSGVACM